MVFSVLLYAVVQLLLISRWCITFQPIVLLHAVCSWHGTVVCLSVTLCIAALSLRVGVRVERCTVTFLGGMYRLATIILHNCCGVYRSMIFGGIFGGLVL